MELINATLIDGEYEFNPPTITVTVKTHYGNQLFYPACDTAKLFCDIARTTTLTRNVLTHIASLGYQVKKVAPQPELINGT